MLCKIRVDRLASLPRDAEVPPEKCLRRGGAETDEHPRLDNLELGLEPRPARGDLGPVRLLVDPPLAAGLPLEVLDDVRHVDLAPVDPGFLERLVQELPRRADERLALLVLLIAGLLADEHHLRLGGALAEDGLRPGLVQRASGAAGGRLLQLRDARLLRNERRRGLVECQLPWHD